MKSFSEFGFDLTARHDDGWLFLIVERERNL